MAKMTLKAARVNAGLTQQEAAKRLEISNLTLVRWENGITQPKQSQIDELCRLYHIAYDDLIF